MRNSCQDFIRYCIACFCNSLNRIIFIKQYRSIVFFAIYFRQPIESQNRLRLQTAQRRPINRRRSICTNRPLQRTRNDKPNRFAIAYRRIYAGVGTWKRRFSKQWLGHRCRFCGKSGEQHHKQYDKSGRRKLGIQIAKRTNIGTAQHRHKQRMGKILFRNNIRMGWKHQRIRKPKQHNRRYAFGI